MAITRANLPPLLRAATALHPPHIPHQNSPTSFLRSHPSNILISDPHLFSTFHSRRVRPRAAAYSNPQNLPTISNPLNLSISDHHLLSRSVHTHATALHNRRRTLAYAPTFGCIAAAGGITLLFKNREKPRMLATETDHLELRFHGLLDMYREGHGVVVEVLVRPIEENKISNAAAKNVGAKIPLELYISATEVLVEQHPVLTAMQRNYTILAAKQIHSKDNDKILAKTKCGEIKISTSADDLSNSESKITVFNLDSKFESRTIQLVLFTFDKFQDLPKLLGEGHSVFVKGFLNLSLNSIKSDEINTVRSDDNWHRIVKGKTEKMEYLFVAEAITKDDERYMPREGVAAAVGRNTVQ